MIAWVDLETTGLDPETCVVLEVACVVTNDALVEVARFSEVTSEAASIAMIDVHEAVREMHSKNGPCLSG